MHDAFRNAGTAAGNTKESVDDTQVEEFMAGVHFADVSMQFAGPAIAATWALAEAEGIVGACKGDCFEAGTLVSFAHVDKAGQWQVVSRPIELARTGEQVVSRNEATGKTEIKRIVSTSHSYVDMVVRVELADAKSGRVVETITGTRRHPFSVEGKGFVPAGALAIGNSIVTRAGPPLVVKSVTWKRRAQGYNVYNFVVEDDHTYFVGKAHGGVWVHNVICPNVIDNVRSPGKFDVTVGSKEEAMEKAGRAFPHGEAVPEATGDPYPKPSSSKGPWYQAHPAEPIVHSPEGKCWPHVKYEDWTRGKKTSGGSWGHIFFPPE